MTKTFFNNFFPPEVFLHITGRDIDFTLAENNKELTNEQSLYIEKALDAGCDQFVNLFQVHGDQVIDVGSDFDFSGKYIEGDAAVTKQAGVALGVRSADCLPIFLYDPYSRMVGIVHAGWKGTKTGIAGKVVEIMKEKGANPQSLLAGFGPCIRPCCYEVGDAFKEHFSDGLLVRDGKIFLDLIYLNRQQLIKRGVREDNINDCGLCTCCNEAFFSYRREGEKAGRHLSLILIR